MAAMDATTAPQIIEHVSKSVLFTPFETRWIPCSARFAVMGVTPRGQGVIKVMEMDEGQLKVATEVEKKDGIKCGTFGASAYEERHLATGDYGGYLRIWDLEAIDTPVFSVKAHESIVNCVDGIGGLNVGNGAPELATCSRDGCVRIWDPRTNAAVASLEPAEGQVARDCWTVAFGNSFDDDNRCVAAGYDNGDIKMLDLRTNKMLWECNVKNGVVGLQFDRRDIAMNKLVVTTLESRFRVYDMRTQHPELGYSSLVHKAHKATVWLGCHLPQNRDLFMTCGGNGALNMYQYQYPDQRKIKDEQGLDKGVMGTVKLLNSKKISDQPIVSFDWSPDKTGLAAMCCLDQTVRVAVVTKLNKL